jgi:hypothetical protein
MKTVASVRDIPNGIVAAFIQPNGTVNCYDTMNDVPINLKPLPTSAKDVELAQAYERYRQQQESAHYQLWHDTDTEAIRIRNQ